MAYETPDFNLTAAIWLNPNDPLTDPADFPSVPAQLYRNGRQVEGSGAQMRIPAAFDNIPFPSASTSSPTNPIAECPVGSGSYYLIGRGLWIHRGFDNEYISVLVTPLIPDAALPWNFAVSDGDLL